eukprot:Hpha_TRINITY_DN8742_c0_g1::TRINITY_DN8742_c0_g1_i1::g.45285::m.45285
MAAVGAEEPASVAVGRQRSPSEPNSPDDADSSSTTSEIGNAVLLVNTWFTRKRTGEEFSREEHSVIVAILLTLLILSIVTLVMPDLGRQTNVLWSGRCSFGCWYWKCGDLKGLLADPEEIEGAARSFSCSKFDTHVQVCRAFQVMGIVLQGCALAVEVTELIRPGMLTVRYRHIMFWFLLSAALAVFVWVATFAGMLYTNFCSIVLANAFHPTWGWGISLLMSIVLLGLAIFIRKGRH